MTRNIAASPLERVLVWHPPTPRRSSPSSPLISIMLHIILSIAYNATVPPSTAALSAGSRRHLKLASVAESCVSTEQNAPPSSCVHSSEAVQSKYDLTEPAAYHCVVITHAGGADTGTEVGFVAPMALLSSPVRHSRPSAWQSIST